MNDLIRELGRKATMWCVDKPNQDDFDAMWEEKFAELLIKECIAHIEQERFRIAEYLETDYDEPVYDDGLVDGLGRAERVLKETFGVNE